MFSLNSVLWIQRLQSIVIYAVDTRKFQTIFLEFPNASLQTLLRHDAEGFDFVIVFRVAGFQQAVYQGERCYSSCLQ